MARHTTTPTSRPELKPQPLQRYPTALVCSIVLLAAWVPFLLMVALRVI